MQDVNIHNPSNPGWVCPRFVFSFSLSFQVPDILRHAGCCLANGDMSKGCLGMHGKSTIFWGVVYQLQDALYLYIVRDVH